MLQVKFLSCSEESADYGPVFIIHASLLIPKVAIQPTLDDVQEVLIQAGKNITSVSKGVSQWTGGKPPVIITLQN